MKHGRQAREIARVFFDESEYTQFRAMKLAYCGLRGRWSVASARWMGWQRVTVAGKQG